MLLNSDGAPGQIAQVRAVADCRLIALTRSVAQTSAALDEGAHDTIEIPTDRRILISRVFGQVPKKLSVPPASSRRAEYVEYFENAADGIVIIDILWHVLFSNPKARQFLGREDVHQVHGRKLTDFLVEDDLALTAKISHGLESNLFPQGVDFRVRHSDGTVRTLSVNFSTLPRDGTILLTFRDVTSERAMEQELRKTKSFLERVIESSVDGIISADLKGNILLFNPAAERSYGYDAIDVVGHLNVEALYPPGVARQIMRLMREHDGRLESFRTEILTCSGDKVPVSVSAGLIFEDGVAMGSVGVFTDLRAMLHMESRLVAVEEELKTRERQAVIAELAGAAAHELNQPLTSVMGYAELMKRRLDKDTPAYAAAEVIVAEAERMAEIVRKIGKITRYETKNYVGQARIIDLDKSSSDEQSTDPTTGEKR